MTAAAPVYRLYAAASPVVDSPQIPPPDRPVHTPRMAYHLRTGDHELGEYDWTQFIRYADRLWGSLPG